MEIIKRIVGKDEYRRIVVLAGVIFVIYLLRDMADFFLMTFIITYLMYRVQNSIFLFLKKFVRIERRIVAVALYLILVMGLVLAIYTYTPKMVNQFNEIRKEVSRIYTTIPADNYTMKVVKDSVKNLDFEKYAGQGIDLVLKTVGNVINALIAFLLSLFFVLEGERVKKFTKKFKDSNISTIYNDIEFFGRKFLNSFGKVIEAQVLISLTNTILSVICLAFLGFQDYLLGMAIMIFLLGLIPVAGVIISLVPLSLIGYGIGGFNLIIYLLIMVAIVHCVETYVLNPKFMSMKTKLPIFYTLFILIISEKLIGMWGLIIGVPIFVFMLEIFQVNIGNEKTKKGGEVNHEGSNAGTNAKY